MEIYMIANNDNTFAPLNSHFCSFELTFLLLWTHFHLFYSSFAHLAHFQADKERAARQREFLAQLERESEDGGGAGGVDYESSEPTSMTNSSTVEGEHTIQGQYDEVKPFVLK